MLAIVYDFLLFLSLIAPPMIFGYLLYLGLHISDHDCSEPATQRKVEQKHPRRLQP
jgi:hypothetical protein